MDGLAKTRLLTIVNFLTPLLIRKDASSMIGSGEAANWLAVYNQPLFSVIQEESMHEIEQG